MSKVCVFEIQIEFDSKRKEYLNGKSVLRQDFFGQIYEVYMYK